MSLPCPACGACFFGEWGLREVKETNERLHEQEGGKATPGWGIRGST